MQVYENNLQDLQGQVIELRSQIENEMEKGKWIMRNAKACEKDMLA